MRAKQRVRPRLHADERATTECRVGQLTCPHQGAERLRQRLLDDQERSNERGPPHDETCRGRRALGQTKEGIDEHINVNCSISC